MRPHSGLHGRQGHRIFAATAVMALALGLGMGAAPSFAVSDSQPDKVWVCKVLGHEGAYHLQEANNPIHVAIASTDYADAFADSHPSFVLQPGDYSGAVPGFGDCEAKWNPQPRISVVKTATLNDPNLNGRVDAGETISYSFLVTNTGNLTLNDITVTDPMLGLEVVSCPSSTLAPDATMTCTTKRVYSVTQADIDEGRTITKTATASSRTLQGGMVIATSVASVPLHAVALISLDKTATLVGGNGNGVADLGESIGYSFLVTNTGNVTLSGVLMFDPMLDGSVAGSAVNCGETPVNLKPGEDVTCTADNDTVTSDDVGKGADIVNAATAWGTKPGGGTVTDTDTVSTPTQQPALDQVGPVDPVDPVVPTISPRITLKAEVVNDAGGTAEVSDFTLTGSSIQVAPEEAAQHSSAMVAAAETTSFSGVTGAAAITNAVVPVGTYFLSESALPSGYSASAWACTGGQLNGSAITAALGNTVECLITNAYSSTVVDSPDVPTGHSASPPGAVLGVHKAAPGAKAPTAATPTAATPTAATPAAATPAVTTLAFTGAEPVPLSLLALLALVLGVALTVAGRRQGSHWARE